MDYKLTCTPKPTHLHFVVTGPNCREVIEAYLAEVGRICSDSQLARVLIEERLEGPRLGTLDVFEIVSGGSHDAIGAFSAVAYVDANATGDLMAFAETVAVNRGLPLRVFRSVESAEEWLASCATSR
jgi:hypothetical protein